MCVPFAQAHGLGSKLERGVTPRCPTSTPLRGKPRANGAAVATKIFPLRALHFATPGLIFAGTATLSRRATTRGLSHG